MWLCCKHSLSCTNNVTVVLQTRIHRPCPVCLAWAWSTACQTTSNLKVRPSLAAFGSSSLFVLWTLSDCSVSSLAHHLFSQSVCIVNVIDSVCIVNVIDCPMSYQHPGRISAKLMEMISVRVLSAICTCNRQCSEIQGTALSKCLQAWPV